MTATEREVAQSAQPVRMTVRRLPIFRTLEWGVCLLAVLFILYPLVRTVARLVGVTDGVWQLPHVFAVMGRPSTLDALRNVTVLVAVGGAIALAVGTFFAWLNARTDARLGIAAEIVPLTPLMVPALAGAIGWLLLASPHAGFLNYWTRSLLGYCGIHLDSGPFDVAGWPGLIFLYALYLTPYVYMTIFASLQSIDSGLEEASRVFGAGPLETFWRISLPSLRPALGASVLQVITIGYSLFSIPVIIGTTANIHVLPVDIVDSLTTVSPPDYSGALGKSIILVAIVVIATLIQRRTVQSVAFARIGGRGVSSSVVSMGIWKWPARLLMIAYLILTSVLPFVGLLLTSLQGFWQPHIIWHLLSTKNYSTVWNQPLVRQGITNSIYLAFATATIVVAAAAIIAYAGSRSRGFAGRAVDAVVKIPAAISHIVVGVAFLIAFAAAPFNWNGKLILLLVAYAVIFLPQASILSNSAIQQIGPEVREAAEVGGATEGRVFLRVMLPLMAPGLLAAWMIVFIWSLTEVNVSSMLASPGRPVAGLTMLDLYSTGSYPLVAAFGVIGTVISTLAVAIVLPISWRLRLRR